ncbi:MAG: glutathione S-transferase [Ponticaulis sp.]|nr:glutathione S-transferase [Ponticaulis sp.]
MGAKYRLFGSETSPYSIKVRSYLKYKKLPFEWVEKGFGTEKEFQSLARSQALPMLVSPKGGVAHDSSTILTGIEQKVYKPSATPNDPACQALALLLEDYADEWLNKVMFHYRWNGAAAAKASAKRQAEHIFAGYEVENLADIEKSIAKSMSGRLKIVGSAKKTAPLLKASFARFLKLLNAHLEHHLFLFGGHPSFADFALAGQLIQMLHDETPGNMIRDTAPFVTAWCEFMEDPRSGAPFENLEAVQETLLPLIRDEVVPTYIAFASANAESIAKKRKTITFKLDGTDFKQNIQNHTNASYSGVLAGFTATPSTEAFVSFLKDAGLSDIVTLGEPAPETEVPEDTAETTEAATETPETAVVPDEPVPADAEAPPEANEAEQSPSPEDESGAELNAEDTGLTTKDA